MINKLITRSAMSTMVKRVLHRGQVRFLQLKPRAFGLNRSRITGPGRADIWAGWQEPNSGVATSRAPKSSRKEGRGHHRRGDPIVRTGQGGRQAGVLRERFTSAKDVKTTKYGKEKTAERGVQEVTRESAKNFSPYIIAHSHSGTWISAFICN